MLLVYIILGFFSFLGLYFAITKAATELLNIKSPAIKSCLMVLVKETDNSDLSIETKAYLHKLRWANSISFDQVLFVDNGLSEQQYELCSKLCQSFGYKLLKIKD